MSAKVAFITGAASGMGQLAARRALAGGWAVSAIDVDAAGLLQLGASGALLQIVADVTDGAAVSAAVARTERELGPIDRVIHAAAIMPLGLALEQDAATVHRVMAINYGGLVNVVHASLPGLLARGCGEFVSFSSLVGHTPHLYFSAYGASKFAVTAYTETLYHEYRGRGVRFACVCPPAVATPLLQQARNTVWPRILDWNPPMAPERVLQAMEDALARGRFLVMPGPLTRAYWRLRRLAPQLLWRIVHGIERR